MKCGGAWVARLGAAVDGGGGGLAQICRRLHAGRCAAFGFLGSCYRFFSTRRDAIRWMKRLGECVNLARRTNKDGVGTSHGPPLTK